MRIRFIWPGKTKDEHLRALIDEYLKRLQRFVRCEVIETREVRGSDRSSVEKESRRILEAILFVEDGTDSLRPELTDEQFEQLAAEMSANAVSVGGADYSRESIYSRNEGE